MARTVYLPARLEKLPALAEHLESIAQADPDRRHWMFELADIARLQWAEGKRSERETALKEAVDAQAALQYQARLKEVVEATPAVRGLRVYAWTDLVARSDGAQVRAHFCAAYRTRDELYALLKPYARRRMWVVGWGGEHVPEEDVVIALENLDHVCYSPIGNGVYADRIPRPHERVGAIWYCRPFAERGPYQIP